MALSQIFHRFNITYDPFDRLGGYTEEISSQGNFQVVSMRNLDYDFADRMTRFERSVLNREGQLVDWERQSNIIYDKDDNILSYDAHRIREGEEYVDIRWEAVAFR